MSQILSLADSQHSPNLDLPLVMPAQAQKHVTVNESLLRLDALVQGRVESRTVSAQPETPAAGLAWILPPEAAGTEWEAMQSGHIAVFRDGFWTAIAPKPGWRFYLQDEDRFVTYHDGAWRNAPPIAILAEGPQGASTAAILIEHIEANLVGTRVVTSAVIPNRAVVFCVSTRTLETVTGAASYDCGLDGEEAKFGGSLGVGAGSSNLGVIGPTAFYSPTPVILTARGGDFTGGRVGIAIHAWLPQAKPA